MHVEFDACFPLYITEMDVPFVIRHTAIPFGIHRVVVLFSFSSAVETGHHSEISREC